MSFVKIYKDASYLAQAHSIKQAHSGKSVYDNLQDVYAAL